MGKQVIEGSTYQSGREVGRRTSKGVDPVWKLSICLAMIDTYSSTLLGLHRHAVLAHVGATARKTTKYRKRIEVIVGGGGQGD